MKLAGWKNPERPHGTRVRYLHGRCRCLKCRMANANYERVRLQARKRGDTRKLVDAAPVRAHLKALSAQGVGYKTVADASNVGKSTLRVVLDGSRTQIRAHRARAVLAVTVACIADGALVPAGPTWKLLDELIAEGYTKTELARRLGYRTHALQLNRKWIKAANAQRVRRLWSRIMV